jgi:hypothetical protein
MKDIMQKLAELDATAPKVSKKQMLNEDSTTPPMNVSNKPASLKDMFENMAAGMKQPIPVVGKQGDTQQTGAGFLTVTDNSPASQVLQKAVSDLAGQNKAQIVVPTTPQNVPAGAGAAGVRAVQTQQQQGQQQGQQVMREVDSPVKARYTVKPTKYSTKGKFMVRDLKDHSATGVYQTEAEALAAAEKLNKERESRLMRGRNDDRAPANEEQLDELSPKTLKSYAKKADIDQVVTNRELKNRYHTGLDPELMKRSDNRTKGMKQAGDKLMGRAKISANEGKKVDRMVKHIEKSEKKSGKSKEEAQDIAWATANKRGMLDNKNKKKVKEGDIAPTHNIDTKGAGLGAGRSQTTLEGKKPDFLDLDKDGNKKESMKKAAADKKKKVNEAAGDTTDIGYQLQDIAYEIKELAGNAMRLVRGTAEEGRARSYWYPHIVMAVSEDHGYMGKNMFTMMDAAQSLIDGTDDEEEDMFETKKTKKKKVKEGMNHRINAARLEGKTHGLRGNAHYGKAYEDMDEMRAYHEGYKEGLDESYGMGMYETAPAATVPGMDSSAMSAMPTMEDEMEEGNAFTAALAKTPKGGKFSVGGKTYTDRTNYDSKVDEYAFESLDKQLNALLTEGEEVTEGLSVSVSKGQQNSPDSVTITAQDAEADQLLQLVKHAGLGLFGDEESEPSSAMSVQPSHGEPDEVGAGGVDVEVVDGNDGIMGLMQKLSGIQAAGSDDYEDEEGGQEQLHGNHEETHEETCNECGGMMEADHTCEAKIDEVESEDQMEFEVAEDNAPDSDEAETSADEDAEAEEDKALAGADSGDEEEIDEGFTFESIYKKFAMLEGSGDKPKHPEHDEKDDKDFDDAEELDESQLNELSQDKLQAYRNAVKSQGGDIDKGPRQAGYKMAVSKQNPSLGKMMGQEPRVRATDDAEEEEKVNEAKESTEKKDNKAEKAGKKVAKDIEYDEGHKGKDDNKAEKAGKKVTKDIEYDDKKKKIDEWANDAGKKGTDASFEQDIDFMTRVISGGLNKPKSTGQTTVPVIAGQTERMSNPKETVTESVSDWVKLAGIK